jgi:hypothetical protein
MLMTETGRHPKLPQYHCLVGHEYDVPDDLAKAWIAKRVADPAAAKKQPKAPVTKPTKDKE